METHGEAQYFLDNYDSSVKVIKDEDEEGALVSRSRIQEEDDENESEQHNQHDGHQAQRHLDVLPEVLAVHLSRRLAERVRLKQAQSCSVRNHHSVQ